MGTKGDQAEGGGLTHVLTAALQWLLRGEQTVSREWVGAGTRVEVSAQVQASEEGLGPGAHERAMDGERSEQKGSQGGERAKGPRLPGPGSRGKPWLQGVFSIALCVPAAPTGTPAHIQHNFVQKLVGV